MSTIASEHDTATSQNPSVRDAVTTAPVLDVIAARWSPRVFDRAHEIPEGALRGLLEAGRWAASAGNTQPWRFIVARRGSQTFESIVHALRPGNQTWAPTASALIVNITQTEDAEGRSLPWAEYDLGQAVALLTLQAHSEGLFAHQMGGFDRDMIREAFSLESRLAPISITALGMHDPVGDAPEDLRARDAVPRSRHAVEDLILPV